jgi:two-component system, chemotaxis family, protein-glutamate methylesterase/glutaminase
LVVEDSAVARDLLVHILNSDPDIQVAGVATDGEAAIAAVERTRPDVVTMDIHMPRLDGFDATRRIMETRPTPIVVVSGSMNINEKMMAFRAVEAGAVAVLPRPGGVGTPGFEQAASDLIRTVKLMSEVKVIRRFRQGPINGRYPLPAACASARLSVVAIGGSTGAPPVLQSILSQLPANFPVPIVIVQHIARGFTDGLADWMNDVSSLNVRLANHNDIMEPGHVYLAPDDHHLKVLPGNRLVLTEDAPENGLRPSVSVLFRSVAKTYGPSAAGILLSGMGADGSAELKQMKDLGAVTIAQDKASSIVYGMPGEAVRLGGATFVLPPEKIAPAVLSLIDSSRLTQRHVE